MRMNSNPLQFCFLLFLVLLFTFAENCARIIRRSVEGYDLYSRIAPDYASVAQWIEQCPPEACAAVRLRPDVYFLCLILQSSLS